VGRLISLLAALTLIAACQNQSQPAPTPKPSPTPHIAPAAAILQASDVPPGLGGCAGNGAIDAYIAALQGSNPSEAGKVTDEWLQLVDGGARAGAISVFASAQSACANELGATPSAKAIASFIAQFVDEGQADRAWEAGVFGFVPPAPGQLTPGLILGISTGLGPRSFTYERPSVRLACWRHGVFVALVVVSNLDAATFTTAATAIDHRLN